MQDLINLKKEWKLRKEKLNTIVFATLIIQTVLAIVINQWSSSIAYLAIGGGAFIIFLFVGITVWVSQKGTLYLSKRLSLEESLFGLLDVKDIELAAEISKKWKDEYKLFHTLFKSANVLRSLATILLSYQVAQALIELANGMRLDKDEYQQFHRSAQKKLTFIQRGKKDSSKLLSLYEKSCVLLESASYTLD